MGPTRHTGQRGYVEVSFITYDICYIVSAQTHRFVFFPRRFYTILEYSDLNVYVRRQLVYNRRSCTNTYTYILFVNFTSDRRVITPNVYNGAISGVERKEISLKTH